MPSPITNSQSKQIVRLLICVLLVLLLAIGYVFYQGYATRVTDVSNQRKGCERGKKDRKDNADFQNAHKKYIEKVVLAQSVKDDVKSAARTAIKTYKRTARHLTMRSKIDCQTAFPDASLLP